jgi:acetoin utilization protein AcuB
MTSDPVTITPDTTFPDAFRTLREARVRHLPVVDAQGVLVGVIARTDLLHAAPSSATPANGFEMSYLLANLHVRGVMSSPAITVTETAPLEEAARVMVERRIGCLPVTRDGDLVGNLVGDLVGIITETDIFETFVEVLGGGAASLRVTVVVPDVRGALARVAGVIADLGGNICSVARFASGDPEQCYLTFRLEGVTEEALVSGLETQVTEVTHVCCAA